MAVSDPTSGELTIACEDGDLFRVTELIESGHQWTQEQLNNFLYAASDNAHVEVCRYLLESGAAINTAPLSVRDLDVSKAIPILELFMEHGWKLNGGIWYGQVLLPYTLQNETLLRWLLDQGADPNIGPSRGPQPLNVSEALERSSMSLEEKAARVDLLAEEWMQKASNAQNDILRQTITKRIDLATLIRYQREGKDPVRMHYRNRAWKHIRQMETQTPGQLPHLRRRDMLPYSGTGDALNGAATSSTIAVIDLLISYGAKLENSTALHHAAESQHDDTERIPVMKHLLELGADISASDDMRGNYATGTPLHCAVKERKLERARFLLHEGADPQKTNRWGISPLEMAHPDYREEFVELFRGWLST